MVWLMLFVLLGFLVLARPESGKLLVVAECEQALLFQAESRRHRRADLATDVAHLPLVPDLQPGLLVADLAQMRLRSAHQPPEHPRPGRACCRVVPLNDACSDIA